MNKLEQFKIWLECYLKVKSYWLSSVPEFSHFHKTIVNFVSCKIIALLPYMASEIEFWCLDIPSEFLKAEYLFPINSISNEN